MVTGLFLVKGSVVILFESVPRLFSPQQPHAEGMILLAILGVAVNGYAAYRVSRGGSLNERMLMWHMIEDVMGWVLVLIGALVMKFFNIPQLDAGLAIVLALWIMYNVVRNLGEALKVFLMATPSQTDIKVVQEAILKIPMVEDVHHGHLWSLDGENHILTAHVVVASSATMQEVEQVKSQVKKLVKEFGIIEATIETEISGGACIDPEHH